MHLRHYGNVDENSAAAGDRLGERDMGRVSSGRDEAFAGVLAPALEVMTAFAQSRDDPSFFWQAVQRVMAEPLDGGDPAEALAGLTFGLLRPVRHLLLEQVAEATGRDQVQVLADIHRSYLAS